MDISNLQKLMRSNGYVTLHDSYEDGELAYDDEKEKLAKIVRVLVAALKECENEAEGILTKFSDVNGLPVGHISCIAHISEKALQQAEKIAKGE